MSEPPKEVCSVCGGKEGRGACHCECRKEIHELRAALRGLVEAIPGCQKCHAPATKLYECEYGAAYLCDEHSEPDDFGILPHAEALRRAMRLVGEEKA